MMVGFWNLNKLRSEMVIFSQRKREIGVSCLRFVVHTRFSSSGILVLSLFSVWVMNYIYITICLMR